MKPNILKIAAILLGLASAFASCRDKEPKGETLSLGMYAEVLPDTITRARYKIDLIDYQRLALVRGIVADTFMYKIRDTSIVITQDFWMTSDEFYFRIINSRRFEIEYLGLYFPEHRPANMIFEKLKTY